MRSTASTCSGSPGSATIISSLSSTERRPWRRILYEEQDYPDNYCGPSFMDGLQRNVTAEHYSLTECILGSGVVCNQLCVVYIFILLYICCLNQWVSLLNVFLVSVSVSVLLYLITYRPSFDKCGFVLSDCCTVLLFFCYGYGLSPVLHTLTATVSTDTIYATATLVFILHLAFHDYGVDAAIVSAHFSLNAAIFAVVCLLSRVHMQDAFVLICLAMQLFAFWPGLRTKFMQSYSCASSVLLLFTCLVVVSLVLLLVALTWTTSACLVLLSLIFISFVCPLCFVALQPLKDTIHGPWDEAILPDIDSLLLG